MEPFLYVLFLMVIPFFFRKEKKKKLVDASEFYAVLCLTFISFADFMKFVTSQ